MITDKQTLLDELKEKYLLPPREKDDVDSTQLSETLNISRRAAEDILTDLVRKGELVTIRVRGYNGHPIRVFRRVGGG